MDVAMRGSMIAQAQQEAVKPGEPMTNQEFTVATRWSDLPQGIRTHIEQSNVELNVIYEKDSWQVDICTAKRRLLCHEGDEGRRSALRFGCA
eukprot:TRINITY_DN7442_c0_g1_i1.p1 TRINITY_DN7442_c0_g1~~TRINITY_DN7442_c0_g1_i1.p1  ORF type:complete len:107 (-),score=15.34 TRINITY_DN7442_c0_g1_i1:410-685(-)